MLKKNLLKINVTPKCLPSKAVFTEFLLEQMSKKPNPTILLPKKQKKPPVFSNVCFLILWLNLFLMLWKWTSKHTAWCPVASSSSLHYCPHPQQDQAPSCPPKILPGTGGCPAQLRASLQRQRVPLLPVHLNAFNSSCSTFPCCITIFPEYDAVLKNGIKCFCETGIYIFFH